MPSTDLHHPAPRFERFVLPSGIRVSVLPTRKLKTVCLKAFFTGDLDDGVTARALLPSVLRRGTRRLPDMKAMQRHLETLYGASVSTAVSKVGEWQILKLRLDVVNGRFLPAREGVFAEALRFLRELLFDPHLEEGRFPADVLEQEKANLARSIEGLIDSKDHYAFERLIQQMCADEPFGRYEYGDLAVIPGIDADSLTGIWRAWASSYPCDIYVAGEVDPEAMRELFEQVFAEPRTGEYRPAGIPALREAASPRYFEERLDVVQGKLCLGYRNGTNYAEGDLAAQVFLNGLFGGFSHSKLFQNVREKAQLAYDVHSSLEKSKGLLFVVAGIAVDAYDAALDIIQEQLRALEKGMISREEFAATRESIDKSLVMLEDSVADLMEVDFAWSLHGLAFDLAEYRARLRDVDRERIVEAARRTRLDSILFLRDRPAGPRGSNLAPADG